MNSPYLSSSSSSDPRTRTDSIFPLPLHDTAGVKKRANPRPSTTRSISSANLERHPDLLLDQVQGQLHPNSESWTAANLASRPLLLSSSFDPPSGHLPFPQPSTTTLPGFRSLHQEDEAKFVPTSCDSRGSPSITSSNMTSLGYLPPPHYGNMAFQDPSFDHGYQQSAPNSHTFSSSNFGFIFGSSVPPSQHSIYAPGPLQLEPTYSAPLEPSIPHGSTINHLNRAISPFHQPNYDSLDFSLSSKTNQTSAKRSSISHSPRSQHMGPLTPPLTASLDTVQPQLAGSPGAQNSIESIRSPSIYEAQPYTSYAAASVVQESQQPMYVGSQRYSYPPPPGASTRQQIPRTSSDSQARVMSHKPKPQCWEHGCNGREFSTFSNLLRHQREKSGTASKSYCPKCGAEFTRTTARNGHLAHEKCSKQRRASEVK